MRAAWQWHAPEDQMMEPCGLCAQLNPLKFESNMANYPVLRQGPAIDAKRQRLRYGGCSCGAVRFTLTGEPVKVGNCHCMECRKATGAVFFAYADWPRAAFTCTGEAREFEGRSFCATCGTRLFHLNTDWVEVALGALDDGPGDLVPTVEGWIKRRELWLAPVAGASQWNEDPPKEAH
jgi:hypothetical protein